MNDQPTRATRRREARAIREMCAERDAAIRSLNESKIRAYATKYGVPLPSNPNVFWIGVHKARVNITSITEAEREESRRWLIERGYSPELGVGVEPPAPNVVDGGGEG